MTSRARLQPTQRTTSALSLLNKSPPEFTSCSEQLTKKRLAQQKERTHSTSEMFLLMQPTRLRPQHHVSDPLRLRTRFRRVTQESVSAQQHL